LGDIPCPLRIILLLFGRVIFFVIRAFVLLARAIIFVVRRSDVLFGFIYIVGLNDGF
jgi:hypothetical protein